MVGVRRLLADSREMSRRSFFALLGWGAFVVASAGALFQSCRYMYPSATYEEPAAFKADPPTVYPVGSTTVLTDKRVVINRDPNGFYAISLICTHLGCTPRYFTDVTSDLVAQGLTLRDPDTHLVANRSNPQLPGFKCPCHGSRYFRDAINFYGPAPRPMDRLYMEVSRDGKLYIDRSRIVDRSFRLKV
jgi:Rieske Fe-S protein